MGVCLRLKAKYVLSCAIMMVLLMSTGDWTRGCSKQTVKLQ